MRINGVLYTFVKESRNGGYNVIADGHWVGWSAGSLTDAKNTARDIARSRA